MSAASMTFLLSVSHPRPAGKFKLCAATSRYGCSGVHVIGHLRTNRLRDVGARGVAVAIAQTMVLARGQVVENQRSVKRTRTARRES